MAEKDLIIIYILLVNTNPTFYRRSPKVDGIYSYGILRGGGYSFCRINQNWYILAKFTEVKSLIDYAALLAFIIIIFF